MSEANALLIDLDGVVYEEDELVAGADEALGWMVEAGVPHAFITNTTSRPREALVDKLEQLGIAVDTDRIVTPAVAAAQWLSREAPGPAALFVPVATRTDFGDLPLLDEARDDGAASVVVGDLGDDWDFARMNRAFRLLTADENCAFVALGMTRYWRAEEGLRLDVGAFVSALEYASGREAVVLGKPSREFFGMALAKLQCRPGEAVMVGDDIVTDVGGAQSAGLRGLLVRTGKFRENDLEGDVSPDGVLDSIADLPGWWGSQGR